MTDKKKSIINIYFHIILALIAIVCVIPLIVVISISLSDELDIARNGYSIFPRLVNLSAYRHIFQYPGALVNAYKVTIIVTFLGTILGTLVMTMTGYALSRRDFPLRRIISFYIFFTMLFHGGLVPTYIVITQYYHLKNTLLVLFLPIIVTAWNTFLLTAYLKSIPQSIIESVKLDGGSEYLIFLRIVLPLSKPALATISLLVSLRLWNEWYQALLYITSSDLVPLQYWMQRVMRNVQFLLQSMDQLATVNIDKANLPSESLRMAMAVLAAGPMMFVFPFFQKYFTKGLQVGAIKG
jgi:putative aldouronate transport system permease protein